MSEVACPACGELNPARFRLCGFCGTPLAPPAPPEDVRKTVTIVFSDLVGSTALGEALDSEALREVMSRYFDAVSGALARHGGTVEKFIGDAVMAVFGLPRVHEDDGMRAVRAAAEMQAALAALNDELERAYGVRLANRTGVNTGEVVAGDPAAGQRLVTGDAVNVAARLEQAAGAGDVLLGPVTYELVRAAVEAEAVPPLTLKGKSQPFPAYRLVALADAAAAPPAALPLVGREAELGALRDAFAAAAGGRACRVVTVLGAAGLGKSRLVDEFARSAAGEARVVSGRCLPYGDGITFWPLAEAVRDAAGVLPHDDAETANAKLAGLVGDDHDVLVRISGAIGFSSAVFSLDETFWAARKLLESMARTRPLVVVLQDLHWAEATFLDLVRHVAGTVAGAPLLILCAARPELLEDHPEWGEEPWSATIALAPLSADASQRLAAGVLGGAGLPAALRERIVAAAEGNPLFVEQLVSKLVDDGLLVREDGGWRASADVAEVPVPPSIQALLAARLDRLEADDRRLVQVAAVVGQKFSADAVAALLERPATGAVESALERLVARGFVRPLPDMGGEYRFEHALVRDAAYAGLLKRRRADLHERFAAWADEVYGPRAIEVAEIVGYHLEQAYRYRRSLGPLDEHGRRVGADAAGRLAAAGRRALARGDMPASAGLLSRAADVLPEGDAARLRLLPDLAEAQMEIGSFAEAEWTLDEARMGAEEAGDTALAADVELTRLLVARYAGEADAWSERVLAAVERALPLFEAAGDDARQAKAWMLLGVVHGSACRYGEAEVAVRRTIQHARLAEDVRQVTRNASPYALVALYGPTPVGEAISRCEAMLAQATGDRRSESLVRCALAQLRAMQGDFATARVLYGTARRALDDLGDVVLAASTGLDHALIELLAGDAAAAEGQLRGDLATLEEKGERYLSSTVAAVLGQAVLLQGRADEAEALAVRAAEAAADDDVESHAVSLCVRARVLAGRGDGEAATRLADEALDRLAGTDAPVLRADTLLDVAAVALASGRPARAEAAAAEAAELSRAKGNDVTLARADDVRAAAAEAAAVGQIR